MPGSPASGSKPEKTMSSRLLTMKFMQRAAASAAVKESSQPTSTEASNIPTPKRLRLSTDGQSSPAPTPSSDLEAISAALAAEEEKRREAVARQAAEAGETEWVLDYSGAEDTSSQYPLVVTAGSLDADDDDIIYGGRQSYGNFKRKKKVETQNAPVDENEDEEDDEELDEADLADPTRIESMINRAKDKASKKEKNKPRPFKLSQLTSISGGRHGSVGGNKSQKKRKHK